MHEWNIEEKLITNETKKKIHGLNTKKERKIEIKEKMINARKIVKEKWINAVKEGWRKCTVWLWKKKARKKKKRIMIKKIDRY